MPSAKEIIELRRKQIFEKCASDVVFYVRNFVNIECKHTDELIQRFDLWPMQEEALLSMYEHRLNVILKARQLGITWLALALATHTMLCRTGRTVICLSRAEEEAKELIRRTAVIFTNMPELIAPEGTVGWSGPTFRATSMDLTIKFPNGPESVMKAFLSSPSAARGFTSDLLILDEWAFQQFAEEIWASVFPTVNNPTSGKVIGLSSIKRGTLFEEIYTNPDNGFNKIFLPWYADPKRTKEWYTQTLCAIGEDKTREEYPSTPEEALEALGGAMFPEVRKETHITEKRPDGRVKRFVSIDYGLDMLSAHWIEIDELNHAVVYREYDSPNKTIGESAAIIKDLTGDEEIEAFIAPPDLWSRSQESGKSRAQLFSEHGLNLVKSSNDFPAGVSAMKEWLAVEDGKSRLQILKAPNLYRCLQKIQKDEKRPDVYAKEPHSLTHDCDSLRYFCVWWTYPAKSERKEAKAVWETDLYEDYENADEAGKAYLIRKYGNPF